MSTNGICSQSALTSNKLCFLWRYFHYNHSNEDDYQEAKGTSRYYNDGLVVGMGRCRRNWPPKLLQIEGVSTDNADFNDFYWTGGDNDTLHGRWKDNGVVFVTWNIYKIGKIIKQYIQGLLHFSGWDERWAKIT